MAKSEHELDIPASAELVKAILENQAKERSMKRLDEALKNLDKNKITEPPSDNPCESCHGVMFCLRCGSYSTGCDNKGNCVCYKCHFCWICEDFLP